MKTVVRQTANMDNRVDAYEDLKIDLTVNLTNGRPLLTQEAKHWPMAATSKSFFCIARQNR
jgi:hypothetical protein